MEALSRREEEEVMENAKKHALKSCDDLVKSGSNSVTRRFDYHQGEADEYSIR